MTIYKLFRNTANDFARHEFGERFFVTYNNASEAREAILKNEIDNLKVAYSVNARTIGREREMASDGAWNRVRVTAAYKKDFSNGNYTGMWYEIVKIETED